jgi:XTP/dITP diphosphohydrolase
MDLVLATTNRHKVREIRAFLKPLTQLDLYSLLDFPHYVPPEESGKSFEENAHLKALHAAQTLKKWAIADDSGLVVPALSGNPGIHSSIYAGKGSSDKENRKKLLKEMEHLEGIGRCAYFECCLALATPEGVKKTVRAICEGRLITKERGSNGFGYDSLFLKWGYDLTFAELDESTKNKVSHRAKALEKLKLTLSS